MYELSIETHFSAAHHLRGYDGKCADLHGHNWKVEVYVAGKKLNSMGMLVDFHVLKEMLKDILGRLDHVDLNQVAPFGKMNPTSENIARVICDKLSVKLKNTGCSVSRVVIRETPESAASYIPRK
jgi:6-pyruvoyltetrahydropterin/6-carboxytetrahydropterin synthase